MKDRRQIKKNQYLERQKQILDKDIRWKKIKPREKYERLKKN
jgi:hypothetical protein